MATTIPAIQGKFGSTDYWVTTMKARELASSLTIPKDVSGWEEMSIEEKYQRDIGISRVKKFIAPYLANDPDRFFGSLIVTVINDEGMSFESVTDVANLSQLYSTSAAGMGFLTLSGGEVLVPLDGQHRLKAIQFAITGKDDTGKDIPNIDSNSDLANEDVTVIFIRHDPQKSRKIFNKVNRYAKPTSKSQNLITDDDDIIAVITREIANDIIGSRLVNFSSNTLPANALEFTTLSTLYAITKYILEASGHKIDISTSNGSNSF